MEYNDLFDSNGIFLETERYILRRIQPEDLPQYEKMAQADFSQYLASALLDHAVLSAAAKHAWDDLQTNDCLTCSILQKKSLIFCGFCQLQWVFSSVPELGIALLPAFHRQGIAMEVLPAFLSQAKQCLPITYFYAKIRSDNLPSLCLAKKLGGICVKQKSLLPNQVPPALASFAKENLPFLTYLEYHFIPESIPGGGSSHFPPHPPQ